MVASSINTRKKYPSSPELHNKKVNIFIHFSTTSKNIAYSFKRNSLHPPKFQKNHPASFTPHLAPLRVYTPVSSQSPPPSRARVGPCNCRAIVYLFRQSARVGAREKKGDAGAKSPRNVGAPPFLRARRMRARKFERARRRQIVRSAFLLRARGNTYLIGGGDRRGRGPPTPDPYYDVSLNKCIHTSRPCSFSCRPYLHARARAALKW